jgi:hypothetical protein
MMRLTVAVTLAISTCGGCGPSSNPTARSPVSSANAPPTGPANPQPPTSTGILVAGTVSDTAWRRLVGATVEVVDGPDSGRSATVGANGEFRLAGNFDETSRFRATKDGHVASIRPLNPRCERCNPNFWIHFELAPDGPQVAMAGNYTLTFTAADTCVALPTEAKTRTYAVTIALTSVPNRAENTAYELTVIGGAFLDNYRSGFLGVAGDYIAFGVGDWHGTPGVVEQLEANTYVGFDGAAYATVATPGAPAIATSFDGLIEYCESKSAMGSNYSCGASEAISRAQCRSTTHRLTLTRR